MHRGDFSMSAGLAEYLRAAARDPKGPGIDLTDDQERVLGLLAQGETPEDVAEALEVPRGRVLLWAREAVEASRGVSALSPDAALSPRQWEVLALLAEGLTDEEIAEALGIAMSSVRSHLERIRAKTGHRRRADLAVFAAHRGTVSPVASGDPEV